MGWAVGMITTALIMRWGQSAEALAWGIPFLLIHSRCLSVYQHTAERWNGETECPTPALRRIGPSA